MKIIDITQRSERWHQWRAQGVTASEAAVVLARSPYQTPWRLWAERTGFAPAADLSANPHVQRGVALEDAARQAFEARHATLLLPVCGESETLPVLRASFDGIADDGAPVELKVPCAKRFAEVAAQGTQSETFRLYWPQVQHQLFVAEAAQGWLVFYAQGADLIEFPVARDEAFLTEELVPKCLAFWERIATRKPPDLDPARDLYRPAGEELDHWAVLAGQYRDLLREKTRLDGLVKETAAELDTLQRALVGLMGAFRLGEAAGLRVTRYLQSGAIDYGKALKALCPAVEASALDAYRKQSAERVRITPVTDGAASTPAPAPVAEPHSEAVASFFF